MNMFKANVGDKIIMNNDGIWHNIYYKKGDIFIRCGDTQSYIRASKDGSCERGSYIVISEYEYELYQEPKPKEFEITIKFVDNGCVIKTGNNVVFLERE